MKILFTILLLVFGCTTFAQSSDETKLIQTVREFHQALVKKNIVSINQQTDKALSYGHSNGWVENKTELMKDLETGLISYQKFTEDSITVSLNGSMANVRFLANVEATMRAVTNTYSLKVLEVWVRKGNRWVLFARQAIKII